MSARSAFAARSARGSSVLLVGIEDAVGVRASQLLESAGHFVSVALMMRSSSWFT